MIRRGKTKVINQRNKTLIQEELKGTVKVYSSAEWQKEMKRRQDLTIEKWDKELKALAKEADEEEVVVATTAGDRKKSGAGKKPAKKAAKKAPAKKAAPKKTVKKKK